MRNKDGTPKLSADEKRALKTMGDAAFWRLWEENNPPAPPPACSLPNGEAPEIRVFSIRIDPGLAHLAADEATKRLIEAKAALFQRGGLFVRPHCGEFKLRSDVKQADGSYKKKYVSYPVTYARQVTPANLQEALGKVAFWERPRRGGYARCDPPERVSQILLGRSGEDFPVLSTISSIPYILPDGEIVSQPGYHGESGIFLQDGLDVSEVQDPVDETEARTCADLLASLLTEFPFVSSVDLSVAMSALITPIARKAFAVAPMHAISATNFGSGKSYLTDLAAAIRIGSPMPSQGARDDVPGELDKGLCAAVLHDAPMMSIDNVTSILGSSLLAQIIERERVLVRVLGETRSVEVPNAICIYASGVNLRIKNDLVRRVLLCSMDREEERPWQHEFEQNPMREILRERGRYIAACLTIARFGIEMAASHPLDIAPCNSFEDWSVAVREPLIRLGFADPVLSQRETELDDPEREKLKNFLENCEHGRPLTTAAIASTHELREIVLSIAGDGKGGVSNQRLANFLAKNKGRIVNNLKVISGPRQDAKGNRTWIIVKTKEAAPLQ